MPYTPVLRWFERISKIPRTSGHEKELSGLLAEHGREKGFFVKQDEAGNLVLRKGNPRIALQGHLDMVGEKVPGSPHDFLKDPIRLRVDGDVLRAEGTTLGADNGIGVSVALSLLDDETIPNLEVLLTTGEETGLTGANRLGADMLVSPTLVNLDGESAGVFLTSCAGGLNTELIFRAEAQPGSGTLLRVEGLLGGHSGLEIGKPRLNAVKVFAELLSEEQVCIGELRAPGKFNAISREASLLFAGGDLRRIRQRAQAIAEANRESEPGLKISFTEGSKGRLLSPEHSRKLLVLLRELPHGVHSMSPAIEGLVESSSNIGVAETQGGAVSVLLSLRSSSEARKAELLERIESAAGKAGASVSRSGAYSGWEFDPHSPLREKAAKLWEELFGEKPRIEAIHAGLECGVLKGIFPDLDMISCGPTIRNAHTPAEEVVLADVASLFRFTGELVRQHQ